MGVTTFDRMLRLAEEFFEAKNDPDQLNVTPEVLERLRKLHPATLSEELVEGGTVAWVLLIPTTTEVRDRFNAGAITESELLDATSADGAYDSIYLCSALVLPEYRHRGIARRLALAAIAAIRADHPIRSLFYWKFSHEGSRLAEFLASETGLPLFERHG
jgi:GNAT superfamily N-acetyltransferase